jgi:Holliday junction DNA helicase RuvA
MIAIISGKLIDSNDECCVVMTGGVGYEIICSLSTLADLQEKKNKDIYLYIYTHVREDALQLFGFQTMDEKNLFLSLLKVNGIGPKSAVNILSGASPSDLAQMIDSEDVKALSKLPKVGKKTAEQMILTLKGKLVFGDTKTSSKKPAFNQKHREISTGLVNLGFRSQDVEKVVAALGEVTVEDGIRQGLASLTGL